MARPIRGGVAEPVNITGVDAGVFLPSTLTANDALGNQNQVSSNPEGDLRVAAVNPLGVLPVAQLTTLHDGKIINRDYPELIETISTSTTENSGFANNAYLMDVGAGEYIIRRTRRFMPYYSGKPQKVEVTFDTFAPQDGIIKRVGYFSSNTDSPYNSTLDGLWLESANDTIRFVSANAGVETINLDISAWPAFSRLGHYQSLSTWDYFTVCEFNFLWLGGAYIEMRLMSAAGWLTTFGYVYSGRQKGTFIKSPNQPVRYEIRSTTGAGSLTYICNQVATGGSISESGKSKGVHSPHTAFTLSTPGTKYPVLGVRQGTGFRENAVRLENFDLFIASADEGIWTLEVNPITDTPATWLARYNAVTNSAIEYAYGDGTRTIATGGTIVAAGTLVQGQSIPDGILNENFLAWLSGSITGVQDELVLCFTPATNNVNVRAAMNLIEG